MKQSFKKAPSPAFAFALVVTVLQNCVLLLVDTYTLTQKTHFSLTLCMGDGVSGSIFPCIRGKLRLGRIWWLCWWGHKRWQTGWQQGQGNRRRTEWAGAAVTERQYLSEQVRKHDDDVMTSLYKDSVFWVVFISGGEWVCQELSTFCRLVSWSQGRTVLNGSAALPSR